MSEGTEHHVEEAEHAQHAARNPFDRRVAMTMAIVAAALAAVTLLSHRAHNEVLQDQLLAASQITKASDQWYYFQAKKNRQYMYEADAALADMIPKDPDGTEKAAAQKQKWRSDAAKYKEETNELQKGAEELGKSADEYHELSELAHHRGNFFDFGELGIELSLVLCSIAVLTKRKPFWLIGILVGVVGLAVAMGGFFVEHLQPVLHVIGIG